MAFRIRVCLVPLAFLFLAASYAFMAPPRDQENDDYADYVQEDSWDEQDASWSTEHYDDSEGSYSTSAAADGSGYGKESSWKASEYKEQDFQGDPYEEPGEEQYEYDDEEDLDSFSWYEHLPSFDGDASTSASEGAATEATLGGDRKAVEKTLLERRLSTPPHLVRLIGQLVAWVKQAQPGPAEDWPFEIVQSRKLPQESGPSPSEAERRAPGWPFLEMVANTTIPPHTVILRLPKEVVVSARALRKSGGEPFTGASDDVILAAWLLRQGASAERPEFLPLLELLPLSVQLPLLWTREDVSLLDFHPAINEVEAMVSEAELMYSQCEQNSIAHALLYTFEEALSVVQARSLKVLRPPVLPPPPGAEAAADDGDTSKRPSQMGMSEAFESFLAPFSNLVRGSFRANARWEIESYHGEEHLVLVSQSQIAVGKAVSVPLPLEATTKLFLRQGIIPQANPYDQFHVFHSVVQLVDYFANNFISGHDLKAAQFALLNDTSNAAASNVMSSDASGEAPSMGFSRGRGETLQQIKERFKARSLGLAEETVGELLRFTGPLPPGLAFESYGYIDPRLWAAYAACCFFNRRLHKPEAPDPDPYVLAELSLSLSTTEDAVTCNNLEDVANQEFIHLAADEVYSIVTALRDASRYLRELARVWIHSFGTTYDEDVEALSRSHSCICDTMEGVGNDIVEHKAEQGCPPSCRTQFPRVQEELAVRFRLNRKRLLEDINDHILKVCPYEQIPVS